MIFNAFMTETGMVTDRVNPVMGTQLAGYENYPLRIACLVVSGEGLPDYQR